MTKITDKDVFNNICKMFLIVGFGVAVGKGYYDLLSWLNFAGIIVLTILVITLGICFTLMEENEDNIKKLLEEDEDEEAPAKPKKKKGKKRGRPRKDKTTTNSELSKSKGTN